MSPLVARSGVETAHAAAPACTPRSTRGRRAGATRSASPCSRVRSGRRSYLRRSCGPKFEVRPLLHLERARAEHGEVARHLHPEPLGERHHRDHRRGADDDAEERERRSAARCRAAWRAPWRRCRRARSFVPQRLDRIEARRAPGRPRAEQEADHRREAEPERHRGRRHRRGERRHQRHQPGRRRARARCRRRRPAPRPATTRSGTGAGWCAGARPARGGRRSRGSARSPTPA